MKKNSPVDIIIPAFNSERTIVSCLNSIKALDTEGLDLTVLVVDNNSTDGTLMLSQQLGFKVVHCEKQGRACARNAGLKHTSSPLVAFVDSDVVLKKDWLQKLIPLFNVPSVGAVQSQVIPLAEKSFIDQYIYDFKDQFTYGTFVEMESLETFNPILDTAACLYQRKAVNMIGGFDESLRFLEDLDLSIRLSAHGFSLRANLEAMAYKISGRNIFEFLIRSMHDAYDMYQYMVIYSEKKSLREVFKILGHSSKFKFQWKTLSFSLLTKANRYFWIFGFIQSFIIHQFKMIPTKEISIKMAKLNLMMKHIKINETGESVVFSPMRRFYFSQKTLIIYGPKEENLLRYQDPEMIHFFKDYLDDSVCDFEIHQKAMRQAIKDHFLIVI